MTETMKVEFTSYVRSLGIGNTLLSHIGVLCDECQQLAIEPFEEMAVSEIVQADGSKSYDLLYFFSNEFVCEVENFVSNPVIWLASFREGPECAKFQKMDFDLKNPTATSRFSFEAHWGPFFSIQPKACGENCLHLLKLAKRYVIPRLVRK